jgi:hypothetical protein
MPKPTKPKKYAAKPRQFYSLHPWQYRVTDNGAEILAYVEGHDWETVLIVNPTSGASAEVLAAYVTDIINQHRPKHHLLHEAMSALELCLEEDTMTYTSEQTAEHVITRIKKIAQ